MRNINENQAKSDVTDENDKEVLDIPGVAAGAKDNVRECNSIHDIDIE